MLNIISTAHIHIGKNLHDPPLEKIMGQVLVFCLIFSHKTVYLLILQSTQVQIIFRLSFT